MGKDETKWKKKSNKTTNGRLPGGSSSTVMAFVSNTTISTAAHTANKPYKAGGGIFNNNLQK